VDKKPLDLAGLRKVLISSYSWQTVDEPGTSYYYHLRAVPVVVNGSVLTDPKTGELVTMLGFVPEKMKRISLYE
jgi:hypothetical protein